MTSTEKEFKEIFDYVAMQTATLPQSQQADGEQLLTYLVDFYNSEVESLRIMKEAQVLYTKLFGMNTTIH